MKLCKCSGDECIGDVRAAGRGVMCQITAAERDLVKQPDEERPDDEPATVTQEAHNLVTGNRNDDYGHPGENCERIAKAINALYGTSFKAGDIPVIQIVMKLSRSIASPSKRDSFVDIAGYAELREMIAEWEGQPLR